jgi:raffinose/stachyose/melibiose transport system substrate-binding protein
MKKLSVILAALLAIFSLVGCSSGGNSSATQASGATTASQSTSQPASAATVTWFSSRTQSDDVVVTVKQLAEEYKAKGNNVTLDIQSAADRNAYSQKIHAMASSGTLPQFFDLDPDSFCKELADKGDLVNMQDYLQQTSQLDKFIKLSVNYLRLKDGSLWAIPFEFSTEQVWYNVDTFNKYGLKAPTTFNEWLNVCKVLQDNGVTPIAIDGKDSWTLIRNLALYPFRRSGNEYLNNLVAGKAKMSDPQGMEALNFIANIGKYFQKGFTTTDYATAEDLFLSGNAAMYDMGTWVLQDYIKANKDKGLNLDYFYIPMTGDGNDATTPNDYWAFGGIGMAANKAKFDNDTKNLLTYIIKNYSKAYAEKGHFAPQNVSIDDSKAHPYYIKLKNDIAKIGDTACSPWDVSLPTNVTTVISDNLASVAMGQMTPEKCAALIDNALKAAH